MMTALSGDSNSSSSSIPLDSLFSPLDPTFQAFPRQSVQVAETEFNDVALDEEDLSSERPATISEENEPDYNPVDPISSLPTEPLTPGRHKKTASTDTIRSSHNLPSILGRLDIQRQDQEVTSTTRDSLDGAQKLQAEFARLQKQDEIKVESAPNSANGSTIDWDFWGVVISDYQTFASDNSEVLAKAIVDGIPSTLRGMMWQLMAASKDPELEQQYLNLLKETSPYEKAIMRDLGRTFPHHAFFTDGQGIGQENLFNVLKAYSLYDPQVGYCQGLPFVVAILLLNMPDEEAFSLLVRLMQVYDLRGHFLPEMPKLQLRLFQFDRLVEELLPVLHIHFLRQGVKSSMFCSQWFLTMFSYRFPLDIVFRIYDNCLASGIEAIFGFSIMLLHKNEDTLLTLKFDEILAFLNTKVLDRYKIEPPDLSDSPPNEVNYDVDLFVNDAVSLRITPFMLDCYAHEYEDLMRETNRHAIEMDELRSANRSLTAQVKNIEDNFAQLSTEHVELLNELVKSRLRNEELEAELVRYKLLYAEAMHENEDAHSSQRISLTQMFKIKRGSNG